MIRYHPLPNRPTIGVFLIFILVYTEMKRNVARTANRGPRRVQKVEQKSPIGVNQQKSPSPSPIVPLRTRVSNKNIPLLQSTKKVMDKERWEFDEKDSATIAKCVGGVLYRLRKAGALRSIREEFMRTRNYIPQGPKEAFLANESRNRYRDVLLLDNTRVVLKNRSSDYIHASKVMVGSNVFICTQGPLENTVESFWAMVFQENVKLIVQLCRFSEEGKEKCYEYLPRNEGIMVFGDFVIECICRNKLPETDGATCGLLEVKSRGRKEQVEHILYENWYDHAAPENFNASFELIQIAKRKRKNAPVVVHCSAGVGRTGCFVGVELAAHWAATKKTLQMDLLLKELRDQRMHSVQTDVQYLYIYRGLIEYLIRKGVTRRLDVSKFVNDYDSLIKRRKTKEQDKENLSLAVKEGRSKDYCPSVYFIL
ncbi:unnamed protein product [Cylicocyclus nassatus]|uniref:Uncharacterized protein n=1 Tax=Cylicocyclus nassatus TaxID=53992 RepID=A0AA36M992_CYLNA|nr:unnamed protein product [Cylicocyclus nassatus]